MEDAANDLGKDASKGMAFPAEAARLALSEHYPAIPAPPGFFAAPGSASACRRAIRAFAWPTSPGRGLWPGIFGSMNSLRKSWSEARVIDLLLYLLMAIAIEIYAGHSLAFPG